MSGLPELEDLRLLTLVAERGSLGVVADELGISQPTVSRRMDALERRLKVPLLLRTTRGTTLTPTGQVVVDWSATLLASAEDFVHSVETLRTQARSALRVAVSMTIGEHHAPGWVGLLRQRLPGSQVSLQVGNSTEVADLVEQGRVDLGFVESPTVRRSLRRHRIGWDDLVVAVRPDHPWAAGGPLAVDDLAAAPLLVREQGSGTRETLVDALRRHGSGVEVGLEMASNTALKSAALAGMGPVVLSGVALAGELAAGELVAVPVPDLVLRRPLTCLWRADRAHSEVAEMLVRVAADRRRGSGRGS